MLFFPPNDWHKGWIALSPRSLQCVLRPCQISYKRVSRWVSLIGLIELILRLSNVTKKLCEYFIEKKCYVFRSQNLLFATYVMKVCLHKLLIYQNSRHRESVQFHLPIGLSISQSRFASNSDSLKFMVLRFTQRLAT